MNNVQVVEQELNAPNSYCGKRALRFLSPVANFDTEQGEAERQGNMKDGVRTVLSPSFTFQLKPTYGLVIPMEQLSLQYDVLNKTKTSSTGQTNQGAGSSNVLQRVAQGDRAAVEECINNYGNLIWSMAKKVTDSTKDAEAVTREIFLDIWRYAERFEQTDFDELLFITLIARRQIRKYSEQSVQTIN